MKRQYTIRFFSEAEDRIELVSIFAEDSDDRQEQIDALWTPEREERFDAVEWY